MQDVGLYQLPPALKPLAPLGPTTKPSVAGAVSDNGEFIQYYAPLRGAEVLLPTWIIIVEALHGGRVTLCDLSRHYSVFDQLGLQTHPSLVEQWLAN